MSKFAVGDQAPNFTLPDSDMQMRSLAEFEGKKVLMYFYPKDDTPGCTIQAQDFSDRTEEFDERGIHIVGISRDDCISHQAFRDKYGLQVTLLADVEGAVCEAYGVLEELEGGKQRLVRSSFLIDEEGIIRFVEYGVAPRGHADHLLESLS